MKNHLVALVIILVSITSCQKQFTIDEEIQAAPPIADSIRLTRIIGFDTTKTTPFDTTFVYELTYDNLNRLKVATSYGFELGFRNIDDTASFRQTLVYTGNDSLPSSFSYDKYGNQPNPLSVAFFTYSNFDGRLTKDSGRYKFQDAYQNVYVFDYLAKYNYSQNFVSTFYQFFIDGILESERTTKSYPIFNNGNRVSLIDSSSIIYPISYPTRVEQVVKKITATYDSKRNPIKLFFEDSDWLGFYDNEYHLYPSNNNILEIKVTTEYIGGSTFEEEDHKFFYKYNNNNLPTEAIITNAASFPAVGDVNKLKFFY